MGGLDFGGGRCWIDRSFSTAWNDTYEVLFLERYGERRRIKKKIAKMENQLNLAGNCHEGARMDEMSFPSRAGWSLVWFGSACRSSDGSNARAVAGPLIVTVP